MNTLILIPLDPNMPWALKSRSLAMIQRMQRPGIQIVIDSRGKGIADTAAHTDRCLALADIRNALVRDYLRPGHTHVMVMDADIIEYDADLPAKLLAIAGDSCIVAPACYVEGRFPRWYDTGGFIEAGERCRHEPPYFNQPGPLIELDSVGACYMAPADVFRTGARYDAENPKYTDHYAVCQHARKLGMKVMCDMRIKVFHADLPKYGMRWHG
jgi:GT2 family glycosyltransferase